MLALMRRLVRLAVVPLLVLACARRRVESLHERSQLPGWVGPTLMIVLALACGPPAPDGGPVGAAPAAGQAASESPAATLPPTAAAKPAFAKPKVAYTPSVPSAGLFLGISHGYFAEEGLEPELVPFDSGEQALPVLATGQVDASTLGLSAGLFGAIARGADLKIVAGNSSNEPGYSSSAFVVRRELIDSGALHELTDLRGRTVAVNSQTGGLAIDVSRGLQSVGLTDADVTWQLLPFPDQVPALANGVIDRDKIDLSRLVDFRYREAALERIGRYTPRP